MLPDIDGPEVCRRLRLAPETTRVPIVFLTARTDEEARVRGLALGADDYIVKPFSVQELLLRIRAVLRRATPVQLRLPPRWVRLRDQFRVWNGYAEIHHARGEWRDCLEVSRSILQNCEEALTPAERVALLRAAGALLASPRRRTGAAHLARARAHRLVARREADRWVGPRTSGIRHQTRCSVRN